MFKFWKKKPQRNLISEETPAVNEEIVVQPQEVAAEDSKISNPKFPAQTGSYAKHPYAAPQGSDTNVLFGDMVVREFIRYENEFIVKLIPTELMEDADPSEEVMLTFGWMPELEEGETYAEISAAALSYWQYVKAPIDLYEEGDKNPALADQEGNFLPIF